MLAKFLGRSLLTLTPLLCAVAPLNATAAVNDAYVYLRCNATSFDLGPASRLTPDGNNSDLLTLDFSANLDWMATGGDTCMFMGTAEFDKWTLAQNYAVTIGGQLTTDASYTLVPASAPATFSLLFRSLGTYRVVLTRSTGTFFVEELESHNENPGPAPAPAPSPTSASRFQQKLGPDDGGNYTVAYTYDSVTNLSWAHAPWNYLGYLGKDPCAYISHNFAFTSPSSQQLTTLLNPAGGPSLFPGGLQGDYFTTLRSGQYGYVVNFDSNQGHYLYLPTNASWGQGVRVLCVLPTGH